MWTFQLDLKLKSEDKGGDTSTYILNGEWDLIGIVRDENAQNKLLFLNPLNVKPLFMWVAVLT